MKSLVSFHNSHFHSLLHSYVDILGIFEGSLKGGFSLLKGIDFTAELKEVSLPSLSVPLLRIGGYNHGENAKLVLVVPGPTSKKEFLVMVTCSVTLLGLTRGTEIYIDRDEMSFKVKGDMFGVLSAELAVAGSINNTANLRVDAVFENKIIEKITQNSQQAVANLCDGAAKGIKSAQKSLENLQNDLKTLQSKRVLLIEYIKKERENAKKRINDAKDAVEERRKEVMDYERLIDREREVVRKERENMKNKLAAARRSLKENEQAEKRIQVEIDQRKRYLEDQKRKIDNEIRRIQRTIDDWNRSIGNWQNSINWHNREIGSWRGKISRKNDEIRRLSWRKFYKKPGLYAQIAYYNGRISALTVARVAIEGSKLAAQGTLRGVRGTLGSANRRLQNISVNYDPKVLALLGKKELVVIAKKAAILILNGAEGLLDMAPIDLDPRVARYIVIKETKNAALLLARESLELLEDVMSDLLDLIPVEMDPRGE